MKNLLANIKNGALISIMSLWLAACNSNRENRDDENEDAVEMGVVTDQEKDKVVAPITNDVDDPYGNKALFERNLSNIKFLLAFTENFAYKAYGDGGRKDKQTFASGVTVKYKSNGKKEGDVKSGDVCTLKEGDIYVGRYLKHDVWTGVDASGKKETDPDKIYGFEDVIKVPIDEPILFAAVQLRYAVGGAAFKKSNFLKGVNAGVSKKELSRRLTGFRRPIGILNRLYFFAALLENKITFDDFLDLRAEGCYSLRLEEICKCVPVLDKNGKQIKDKYGWPMMKVVTDKDDYATWDFSNIKEKLEIAKKPRDKSKAGECKLVKETVMDYIWEEVSNGRPDVIPEKTTPASDEQNEPKKEINRKEARKAHDDAVAKSNAGDYQGALDLLLPLTETRYDNAVLENDVSFVSFQLGEYDVAKDAAQKALEMSVKHTDSASAYYNLGVACAERYELFQARDNLEKSLGLQRGEKGKATVQAALDKVNDDIEKSGWGLGLGLGALGGITALAIAIRRKKQKGK